MAGVHPVALYSRRLVEGDTLRPPEVAADHHSFLGQDMELNLVGRGPAEVQDMAPDFGQGMVLVGWADRGRGCKGEELHWEIGS